MAPIKADTVTYSHAIDHMGHVTIHRPRPDGGSESLYLQGDDALQLIYDLAAVRTDDDEQRLLAEYDLIEQWDRDA